MQHLTSFLMSGLASATSGGRRYHVWMGSLTLIILGGAYAYYIQLRYGLGVTGMNDHVSWGLYISNFTFLVGLAAGGAAVSLWHRVLLFLYRTPFGTADPIFNNDVGFYVFTYPLLVVLREALQ